MFPAFHVSAKPEQHIVSVTLKLLKILNVNVTSSSVKEALLSHPDFPSLLSIADVLKKWHIESLALKIGAEQLRELPLPFLAHTTGDASQALLVITEVTDVSITHLINGKKKVSGIQDFLNAWDGNVLIVEASNESGESDFRKKRRNEWWQNYRIPMVISVLLLLGFIRVLNIWMPNSLSLNNKMYLSFLFLPMTIGLLTVLLLLWNEYDLDNPFLQKVCGNNPESGCAAVLQDASAKVLGIVSWTDIGFVYFIGSFLFLSIGKITPALPAAFVCMSFLTTPAILLSIFYQKFVIKRWCRLCLVVQACLFAWFAIGLLVEKALLPISSAIQNQDYLVIFLAYFIPAAFWLVCKPFLYDAKKGRELGYRLSRFKNNEETFKSLLTKQKQIKGQVADLGILIGPSEARNNIIKVCNPFCGPCAEAHPKIEHLIENKDDWNLRVIFTTSADETLRAFKPVTHFMAIASEEGPLEIKKALTDWYSDPEKNYEAFASRHPIKTQPELQKTKLTAMRDWCEEEGVQSTPTIYVNGYRLPEHYRIEELDFL